MTRAPRNLIQGLPALTVIDIQASTVLLVEAGASRVATVAG